MLKNWHCVIKWYEVCSGNDRTTMDDLIDAPFLFFLCINNQTTIVQCCTVSSIQVSCQLLNPLVCSNGHNINPTRYRSVWYRRVMFIKHLSAAAKSYRTYRLTLTSLAQACFAKLAVFVPHLGPATCRERGYGERWWRDLGVPGWCNQDNTRLISR